MKSAWVLGSGCANRVSPDTARVPYRFLDGHDRRVLASAEKYRTDAKEHGVTWAGTMYNEWRSRRHSCAILGRMLGHAEAIRHLEELDYPPLPANGYGISAHSMLACAISSRTGYFRPAGLLRRAR